MLTVDQLLSQLTKAVSYAYRRDATSPGVLFSNLKDGSVYTSIVRYGTEFPKGKKVVCNAKADSLPAALSLLTEKFLSNVIPDRNPVESLKELISKENECFYDGCNNHAVKNKTYCTTHKFMFNNDN